MTGLGERPAEALDMFAHLPPILRPVHRRLYTLALPVMYLPVLIGFIPLWPFS